MTTQSMQMPTSLFVWAVRVLYTWYWPGWRNDLSERVQDNPLPSQRAWVIAQALLVMLFQIALWIAVAVVLVTYPYSLISIGRGGMWLSTTVGLGIALIVYSVFELWIYTRRYADDFGPRGHAKFLRMWPDWVRYVLPIVREGNDPHMSAARLVVLSGILFWLQFPAQDWDLQYLTRTEQTCSVVNVSASRVTGHGFFELKTRIRCADAREFAVTDGYMSALTWNNRDPLQCLTYEGGFLSCSRK